MSKLNLVVGEHYKFKGDFNILKYIGKKEGWHQFEKIGGLPNQVWCELPDYEIDLLVKAQPPKEQE